MAAAELPMYDLPELRSATDAWWVGLARALRREEIEEVPDQLIRERSAEGRPDLLLSQVCGSSLVGEGRERLTYVATPCYTAPGATDRSISVIVVAATSRRRTLEDLRGCARSWLRSIPAATLRATFVPLAQGGRFFASVTVSGGPPEPGLIASGQADMAAIDCITYAC
jgi:hypothetical protein